MNRRNIGIRVFFILLIGFTFIPYILSPLQATTNEEIIQIETNVEDSKLYKVILFKTGDLGETLFDTDLYHFDFKEGKTYIVKAKIKIEAGSFDLIIAGPGGIAGDFKIWDVSSLESEHYLLDTFTATDSGDHSVSVGSTFASNVGDYSLYINQVGFAGWWWILAAGLGFLVIIILALVLIARSSKKKSKRKSKRKR